MYECVGVWQGSSCTIMKFEIAICLRPVDTRPIALLLRGLHCPFVSYQVIDSVSGWSMIVPAGIFFTTVHFSYFSSQRHPMPALSYGRSTQQELQA